MPKIKKYYIPDPIYHSSLYLVISDYKNFLDYIKKLCKEYNPKDHVPDMQVVFIKYKCKDNRTYTHSYLWMPKWEFERNCLCELVHELSHFAIRTMSERGIEIDEDKNESYCYYVEYIFYEILLKLESIYLKTTKREYEDD